MRQDETITLPTGIDFREPGHNYIDKLFKGESLKRLWRLLDTPDGRPRVLQRQERE